MLRILFLLLLSQLHAQAQQKDRNIGMKWSPSGLFAGNISLYGEYNFGRHSLTAKVGVPLSKNQSVEYDDKDAKFTMKATSFLAGYRMYLSKKQMKGFYFEPFFKYVHHSSEGVGNAVLTGETVVMNFTNTYNGIGAGAQLGVQFMIKKRVLLDFFFLGPEINASRNKFSAIEISDAIPWTDVQAGEAERDIREFIDEFPFIRNKVNVMVDQQNKTVVADFKGSLPGWRMGIALGFVF